MDNKELANLIFPNAKDISYYEEMYPERNLKEGAMVTRFAPSPTGFVHIGGVFGSVVDRKLAQQTGRSIYFKNRRYRPKKGNRKWCSANSRCPKRF